MLSSVLHSTRAVQVNVAIMRAFVQLREIMARHNELADNKEIQVVYNTLKKLIAPPAPRRRRIGYVA